MAQPDEPRSEENQMHPEHSPAETATVEVPKELLQEMQRRGARRHDFTVEGWKPSFFDRIIEKLTGSR